MPEGMGQSWSLEAAYHWPEVGGLEMVFRNGPPGGGARVARFSKWKHNRKYCKKHTKSYLLFNWNPSLTGCPVFYLSVLERDAAKAAMETAAGKESVAWGCSRGRSREPLTGGPLGLLYTDPLACTLNKKIEPEPIRNVPSCHRHLAMFPQCPLLTKPNIEPTGKEEMFHKARPRRVDWGPRLPLQSPAMWIAFCLLFVFSSPLKCPFL